MLFNEQKMYFNVDGWGSFHQNRDKDQCSIKRSARHVTVAETPGKEPKHFGEMVAKQWQAV